MSSILNSVHTVAKPVFSPSAGHYSSPKNITITTTTQGASIYFTTDGRTPTKESNLYTSPIPIWSIAGKSIQAIAIKSGSKDSEILRGVFSYPPLRTVQAHSSTFSNSLPMPYWSSITLQTTTNTAMHLTYSNGNSQNFMKTNPYYVRCVADP
ncbi:MAG: chitobiase/beta-hexosaminidase C-terminal domain-containing protein [Leptospiraceae bacterium]|nr:chitobiase/beta-hexosaminidase C-terminal domain-containing protein [Leptospiraceae bacterium]NUM41829.1 chitobiase/beta-hexosaminidase C-terminal domain-containing protein [Leptospiraceae bacterium]